MIHSRSSPARRAFGWLALGAGLAVACLGAQAADLGLVKVTDVGGKVRIEIRGQLFTEYHYKDVSRPFFYPILGPDQVPMTRDWPMQSPEGEEHDHKHHRSLWWAHGSMNGQDFWSEEAKAGVTVHQKFTAFKSGPDWGHFRSQDQYVAKDGTIVATDDRVVRVYNRKDDRILDFEITLHASHGDLTFGDTKEGTMAIRLAESMRLTLPKNKPGAGHIVNSEGVRDGQTWGKKANWCDYYGPVHGQIVGVAMFDHPDNPRHPTSWHVRDYGLFAANPFGLHDFEKLPKDAGNLVVPAGKSVTFRYRFYFHRGDDQQSRVAEHYADYVKGTTPPP